MSVLIDDQKQGVIMDEENHATLFAKRNSSSDKILEKVFEKSPWSCTIWYLAGKRFIFIHPKALYGQLRQNISMEDVDLLEELLILEGILFDPVSADDFQSAYEDVASRIISSLQHAVKELQGDLHKVRFTSQLCFLVMK